MAATYSVAGLVAGISGANVQIALQHPIVIGITAALFVTFAFAMFGWINVQMPRVIQNKINAMSDNQLGGQYTGVAVMGVLSALVVGPCVAAPLAGALLFIAQTGDAVTGGLALFAMGLGMGVPLLLVGTSASKWIPKTGPWMHRVKVGFGFLMLLMALWMTDRVWPEATLILVALIAIAIALVLAFHHRWQPPLQTLAAAVISYTLAMFLGLYGSVLVVGQLAGTGSLLQPLGNLAVSQPRDIAQALTHDLNLIKVLPQEVAPLLQQAKLDQQPVMLDFYADWCISCKELDSFVFTDSRVKNALKDFKAIKVDVTINSAAAQQLLQSMQLVGPPALVFYNAKGQLYGETVIGVPAINDLVTLLQQVNTL
jgi:thiol:disulfide interchange protein DsbD